MRKRPPAATAILTFPPESAPPGNPAACTGRARVRQAGPSVGHRLRSRSECEIVGLPMGRMLFLAMCFAGGGCGGDGPGGVPLDASSGEAAADGNPRQLDAG